MLSAADLPATLTQEERLRYAQEAYRAYYPQCFWSMPRDFAVTEKNLFLIIDELKLHGGHRGWKLAQRLCR